MNDMTPAVGHNNPPISAVLAEKYEDAFKRADDLLAAAETAPRQIDDDETQNKVAELIKETRKLEIHLDKARSEEKEPFQAQVERVNGFFKAVIAKLEKVRKELNTASESYLERKKAAEARRLKEEEDRRREEADRKLRIAREAEETKNAAQNALNELKRLQDDADSARAAAVSEQEVAAANLAQAKVRVADVRARIAASAADFARMVAEGTPATDGQKAETRQSLNAELETAKAAMTAAEDELRTARQRAAEAKAAALKAEEEARAKAREVKTASRDQDEALNEAVRETRVADRIAAKVENAPADLARTRSEHGAVSTLTRRWESRVTDRSKLDMAALWPHIHGDALEAALFKWMNTQPQDKRVMAGAVMEEVTVSQVR